MSHSTLASLTESVRQAAIDLVWRQWSSVGAQAAPVGGAATLVVDPESLVLATLALETHERRLTDLLEDWVAVNSGLLSVQRLRNLRTHFPESSAAGVFRHRPYTAWVAC